MTAARLMLRRHRLLIGSWSVLLVALAGGTVSAYQSTYPTERERRAAVDLIQHDAATTLLYGRLPDPGTPAQMFAWEVGALATLLVAVMAVVLAVALTRAAEEDGTLELMLTSGADRRTPIRAACGVLVAVAAVLAAGCATGAGLAAGRVDGVTWPGALAFGAVLAVTLLVVGALTMVLAQVVASARAARRLGMAAVGVAFVVRAFADTRDAERLNWASPLALSTTAGPFTHDRWWALAAFAGVAGALAWLAVLLSDRREYGAGLLPATESRDARLNIRSGLGLTARLFRGDILTWTVAVACVGALFASMGSTVVQQSREGDLDGFLGSQLESGDPEAAYLAYCGTAVGIAVAVFAVLSVLRTGRDEREGLADHVLATGTDRWRPLAWNVTATAVGCALILLVTGAASALIAPMTITGTDVALRAFTYSAGQWPAAMAAAGWTALLVGLRPGAGPLAWVLPAAGGTLALLGRLFGVPQAVQDLGIFQHVPDPAAARPGLGGLAVLLAVAAVTVLAGVIAAARRDVVLG
ncbi:hypothetical protein [Spirillospora albida]|uniref:hypothetical protein n=1 Tax=Spirillospora albida TaxID=58123 RepID=UPI0004BE7243|nr:hypothetical protein [Spirillospora albida]